MVMPPSLEARNYQCPGNANKQHKTRDSILQINAPLRVIFGRSGPAGGEIFGSRAIPQAQPRTSETPNISPPAGPNRGTKKRPCARWIRMPDRGSLWLLPSGPDQIRNMSSSEPIERARRSVYLTRSRPAGQVGRTHRMDSPHSCISLAAPAVQGRAARCGQRADAGHGHERLDRQAAVAGVGHAALGAVAARAAAGAVI